MKYYFYVVFLTSILLSATHFLFLDDLLKIRIQTTANAGSITVAYLNDKGETVNTSERVINGRASLRIYSGKMEKLCLTPPEGTKITEVKITGRKKQSFTGNSDEWFNKSFKAAAHFDFKIFVIITFLYAAVIYMLLKRESPFDSHVPQMMNMEFLRLIFALGIVSYHLAERLNIFNEGWLGVEFFFILSGFFLTITFTSDRTTADFVKSKLIHFIPLLFMCAFFSKAKIIPVLSNILLLQSTGLSDDVVPPQSWFLAVLFWVSLFYFYMMKICPVKVCRLVFALLTFFSYTACRHFGWDGMINNIFSIRLLRGVAGIGLGYFIAYFYQISVKYEIKNTLFYTVSEMIVLFYVVGLMFIKEIYPENQIVAVITFACLIFLFSLKRGGISGYLNKPFLAKISACSFTVYMTHWVLIVDVILRWNQKFPVLLRHKYVLMAGTIMLAWIFGVCVHKYVEKPITAFLKRKMLLS